MCRGRFVLPNISVWQVVRRFCSIAVSKKLARTGRSTSQVTAIVVLDLPRDVRFVFNKIRIGYAMFKRDLKDDPACECGYKNRTMHHAVIERSKRMYNKYIKGIRAANTDALE